MDSADTDDAPDRRSAGFKNRTRIDDARERVLDAVTPHDRTERLGFEKYEEVGEQRLDDTLERRLGDPTGVRRLGKAASGRAVFAGRSVGSVVLAGRVFHVVLACRVRAGVRPP